MSNHDNKNVEEILEQSIKTVGQAYFLSEDRARHIVGGLKVVTPTLASRLQKDRGRPVTSNFMNQVNIFMSTTAKAGLVVLVLGLFGVFGYTQLGTSVNSDSIALNTESERLSADSVEGSVSSGALATAPIEKASGDIDEAVSAILASATSEGLVLSEEEADVTLINSDDQELQDFNQAINENDF